MLDLGWWYLKIGLTDHKLGLVGLVRFETLKVLSVTSVASWRLCLKCLTGIITDSYWTVMDPNTVSPYSSY